jgi:hypothetical protein
MSEQAHVKAVREFLEAKFPDFTIEDRFDSEIQAHSFRISGKGNTYITAIKQEVLNGVEPSGVASRLSNFLLVEHLVELPGTLVVVTSSGLKLEYD